MFPVADAAPLEFVEAGTRWTAKVLPAALAGVGGLAKRPWLLEADAHGWALIGSRYRGEPRDESIRRLRNVVRKWAGDTQRRSR